MGEDLATTMQFLWMGRWLDGKVRLYNHNAVVWCSIGIFICNFSGVDTLSLVNDSVIFLIICMYVINPYL